ncbi:acyl-ACP--UDP-N-acetylglucosamine O-acyltransferase [Corallococcus exiguus]|uniref:Acyl-[acyl-carrier-protein]--UDP-N-acetylglucosamine O-acyltransferase n=1 Tax=Corallococcus exiguus TaxID=83462 RepID=A0A7Y1S3G9_9BACT|nr:MULTISPECIES: acyl-ACP--UDP-N-acetylglucosamine O-acyltransferase [Corallococcus]RKI45082.1 acyl-ACP--UDP-N-acetylglucosamine O-acyltransferase [Corallococcus sp. AB004]NBC45979.1 acyl-ACP--UDP-N-acetylglucosamine O-acyltransferase [Corallococcus exiguus]NNC17351.1 acyl-ACP--UDP-N-acetylglucosamine O-acyltransferase [Corallococcus exiguus]NPC70730.1 acyl-ACP--UDP-N-acetylglucosamine O-acyltransferase [Corallococcus exiguus]NPD25003.1 acyl-ACP--UDP-N-acetylglucosamine O-acyltransferase [Cora
MAQVHPTAVVHPGARLHDTVEVGPFSVIGPHVVIGAGTRIGPHVVIEGRTTLGERNHLFQFCSVGAAPQDLKYAGEDTELVIGDENQIREFVTVNLGTVAGGGATRLGHRNLLLANSHIAHDCVVGNEVLLANGAALAGHVVVEDAVKISGLVAVHQFTRLGRYAFISGGSMVTMDVPPYCTVQGDRATLVGLNTVGLERGGFTEEQIGRVKEAYRILFRSKLGLQDALAQLRGELSSHPEVEHLVRFVETSKRGVTR